MLAQQLSALKGLVDAAPSRSVREQLLGSHADSIKAQILNKIITKEEVTTLPTVIRGLPCSAEQKSGLLMALSTSLLRAQKDAGATPKSQVIVDLLPYLTASEWGQMQDKALSLRVKLQKMADIYIKLSCWYPGEPTKGLAVSTLKRCHPELEDPQSFNSHLKVFKGLLAQARKRAKSEGGQDGSRVDLYNGNPKDLPKSIYMKAYSDDDPPLGPQDNGHSSNAICGPLRGTDKDMKPAGSASSNACSSMPQMAQLATFASMMASFVKGDGQHGVQQTPVQAPAQVPAQVPAPAPAVQQPAEPSVSTAALQMLPAQAAQADAAVNTPPPISPAKQAKAMAAAWGQEEPRDDDGRAPGRGRAGRGRGRGRGGRGRGRGRGRVAMKQQPSKGLLGLLW